MSGHVFRWRGFLLLAVLFGMASLSQASAESARYLRNALHYYQIGQYEKAKGYFIALLSVGTSHETALARRYLAKPELQHPLRSKTQRRQPSTVQSPPPRETESLLEEPELAPERQQTINDESESRFHLSGNLRNQTAFRISEPTQLSQLRTLGYLAGTGQWSDEFSYKVSGRLWYDAVYDLTNHYPRSVADDQRTDGELRDTYVDLSHGDWDARIGKQQIVWGEAIGSFYADTVNARDLRESVLPDFDLIRIPEWGTNLEYRWHDFHAETIWLPFPEMDKVARAGAEFGPPILPPGPIPTVYAPEEKPRQSLDNSELGGKLSYLAGGWDFGAFYLRTWDKFPVYLQVTEPEMVVITPTHPRLTEQGFTFAKDLDDVILKGEFVYNLKKYFQSSDPAAPDGVIPKDYVDYLLGADYVLHNTLTTSVQLGQQVIPNYESSLLGEKKIQSTMALFLRDQWLDDRLEPEFEILQNVDIGDRWMRVKMTYRIGPSWRVAIGADFFSGSTEGMFGQFSGHNQGTFELRYDFSYPRPR